MMKAIHTKSTSHLGMVHVKISSDRLQEYIERVKKLQEEFDKEFDRDSSDHGTAAKIWYSMVMSIFPGPNFQ
ncbi:hypothetical protein NDK47_24750 [Brevibacillus ruminantium]|uniref:Uncharacterized protein n=1 Tax=Brevibacillus ruminantium TaxID=2950604 RepID=A0ABY4WEW2_9BACL|nr:hypothetical protein [Brevibacillus ruminantium]USG65279.1 hypothetical protein NDK47_24750 [Brevibacillus ruminantium]